MTSTDYVILLSILCVGGAIAIAVMVLKLPALEHGTAARRVRTALLVCSLLVVSGTIALSITANSLTVLRARMTAFDSRLERELERQSERQEAAQSRFDAAVRIIEAKFTSDLLRVSERTMYLEDKLAELRTFTVGALAIEIARTQQAVAEQSGFSRLESVVLGEYVVGMEMQALIPAGVRESDDELWWVEFSEFTRGMQKLKARRDDEPLAVCLRGVRSVRGRFGHLGGYPHLFLTSEVLAVGPAAEPTCARTQSNPPIQGR